MNLFSRRLFGAAVAAALVAGSVAACGGDSTEEADTAKPAGSAAPLYAELPADQQKAGKIVVGSDIAYAPMEYFDTDGETVLGFDKELGDKLGAQLGVEFEFQSASFDGLITSLKSGRFDLVMSGMSDTKERQAEVDFVDYYVAGAMMLVKKGNPEGLATLADLCGKTIAVQRGTTQEGYAQEQSAQCEKDGGQKIDILSFDRETEAMLQIKQGRAVAGLQDYPVATYNVRESGGEYEVVGEQIQAGPLGIAVDKADTALRDVVQKALAAIIANGEYGELIDKWEIPAGAVTEAEINAGT
ncbi:amino acid ABC transporter substrate-binding protein (PAAT family) [Actinocorallia herbida]|uniref:Amino acid ABC transporter substrate-binding protein (PAAT family) n=1 Tax=Actinocorallia herbida TaxID=58109 RepID=A0A3N1CNZ4_9ACTN|nr:ABC transporter substrate-binding protein [Actinocorallia herbida]ROO82993.1 amino acid ABC transporter substrate-binding protein (PAAT family) [Actinocorallia herbida]